MKSLRQIEVNTWLAEPENAVTLKVTMESIPDGIGYPGSIVFSLTERMVVVTLAKSNDQKIVQSRSVDTQRSR